MKCSRYAMLKGFLRYSVLSFLISIGHGAHAQDAALVTGDVAATEPEIRIGIIGDQTFSTDLNRSYGVMAQGVQVLSGKSLDVVIHTGDLLESSASEAAVRAQF